MVSPIQLSLRTYSNISCRAVICTRQQSGHPRQQHLSHVYKQAWTPSRRSDQTQLAAAMASLPPDFLLTPTSGATVTSIDFANTPLPEYADLQAFVIDNALTSTECTTLLAAAQASSPWQRAMIQVGNGLQRQEDHQRKCGRLIWDSSDVAQRIWDRVKLFVPHIARLDRQAELTGGNAVMRGEVWETSRLNERMRFLKYEGGEYFRGSLSSPLLSWSFTDSCTVHEDGVYQTPDGSERSFFTFHLYLNGHGHSNHGR